MLASGILVFILTEYIALVSAPRALLEFIKVDTTPEEAVASALALILIFFSLLVLVRYFRERNLIGFFFFLSLFFGLQFLFSLYLPSLVALLAAFALVLGKALGRYVITQNLALIPGLAGIGVAVGLSLTPYGAMILLVVLSLYDILAVYFTKHMVAMFRGMLQHGVIPAIIIPEKFSGLFKRVYDISPGSGFMLLGTGDIVIPAIFAVSVSSLGNTAALAAVIGSVIGFISTELIFTNQRFRKPMPALPPIATCTILGFLVERLVTGL